MTKEKALERETLVGCLKELHLPAFRTGYEELARQAAACAVAPPFAVARLWLDRDVDPARPVFNAVSREPTLDSVTVYSRLERPSAEWAARTGGSVVELHSYACTAPDGATATERMRAELRALALTPDGRHGGAAGQAGSVYAVMTAASTGPETHPRSVL